MCFGLYDLIAIVPEVLLDWFFLIYEIYAPSLLFIPIIY